MVVSMMTGSRDIDGRDAGTIKRGMADELFDAEPERFLFGGARGSDTVALKEAGRLVGDYDLPVELIAIVPWTLEDQPNDAIPVMEQYADRVIELEHDTPVGTGRGYFARNDEMIGRADRCRVFWNGESGGTHKTAESAVDAGLVVRVHELGSFGNEQTRSVMAHAG